MKKYYFKDCFYILGVSRYIPEDAVEISEDFYYELLEGQSDGMCIMSGEDGMPYLTEPVFEVDEKEEIIQKLEEIDRQYRTSRIISMAAVGDDFAIRQIKEAEKLAAELRARLKELDK